MQTGNATQRPSATPTGNATRRHSPTLTGNVTQRRYPMPTGEQSHARKLYVHPSSEIISLLVQSVAEAEGGLMRPFNFIARGEGCCCFFLVRYALAALSIHLPLPHRYRLSTPSPSKICLSSLDPGSVPFHYPANPLLSLASTSAPPSPGSPTLPSPFRPKSAAPTHPPNLIALSGSMCPLSS